MVKRVKRVTTVVKKTTKPRRKNRSGPKLPKRRRIGNVPSNMLAQSLANPFDYAACIPDASAGTGCFSVKSEFTLATGATGTCGCLGVALDPSNQYKLDTGSTASTLTITGNWNNASSIAVIQSLYGSFRGVSLGLRAVYVGNTQTDGGVIMCGVVPANVPIATFNGTNLASAVGYCKAYKLFPLRAGAELTWRPDSMDDMMAWTSTSLAATTVTSNSPGTSKPWLLLAMFGAASGSTTALQIEMVANYEGQISNQSIMGGGTSTISRAPAEPGWYEKAMEATRFVNNMVPFIGAAYEGYDRGGLVGMVTSVSSMAMGNGYSYPSTIKQANRPLIANY